MAEVGTPILEGKYSVTMDMWPIEAKEFNRVFPFYEHLREGRLTTTQCNRCKDVAFPPRVMCPRCHSDDLSWIDLPTEGRVIVFTEQIKGVPLGFDPPLIHAWIDLGPQSPIRRLLTRIINCPAGTLKEGQTVRLVTFEVPAHPMEKKKETVICPRVFFAFEPKDG
jgi:hypothetical protein